MSPNAFDGVIAMPIHDWSRVEAGIFRDFHNVWYGNLRSIMNEGVLPKDYYALVEQAAGNILTDVSDASRTPDVMAAAATQIITTVRSP